MVSFGDAVKRGFAGYATFAGRSTRAELWWWALFYWLVLAAAAVLATIIGGSDSGGVSAIGWVIYTVASLALILPTISVTVRRLHDIDKSGWWYWIQLVPCVGPIILLVFAVTPSTPGQNQYG